jgi:hypothetical protein
VTLIGDMGHAQYRGQGGYSTGQGPNPDSPRPYHPSAPPSPIGPRPLWLALALGLGLCAPMPRPMLGLCPCALGCKLAFLCPVAWPCGMLCAGWLCPFFISYGCIPLG